MAMTAQFKALWEIVPTAAATFDDPILRSLQFANEQAERMVSHSDAKDSVAALERYMRIQGWLQ